MVDLATEAISCYFMQLYCFCECQILCVHVVRGKQIHSPRVTEQANKLNIQTDGGWGIPDRRVDGGVREASWIKVGIEWYVNVTM